MEVCYHDYANPLQWLCKSHDNTDAILFDHFTNDVTIRAFLDVLAENFGGFGGTHNDIHSKMANRTRWEFNRAGASFRSVRTKSMIKRN